MPVCDPCKFCEHLVDDSDPSVGLYGQMCEEDCEWCEDTVGPCPEFKPRLPSKDLLDQIDYEMECQCWLESQNEDDDDSDEDGVARWSTAASRS